MWLTLHRVIENRTNEACISFTQTHSSFFVFQVLKRKPILGMGKNALKLSFPKNSLANTCLI